MPSLYCPQLMAYPPIILEEASQLINTATDIPYSKYSQADMPYERGDIVQLGEVLLMSTVSENFTLIAGAEHPQYRSWGAVTLDGSDKLQTTAALKTVRGIPLYDQTPPPKWHDSGTAGIQTSNDVDWHIPRNQASTYAANLTGALDTYYAIAAPDVPAPVMKVSLGGGGYFHIVGNRGSVHDSGGTTALTITLRPNEFLVYVKYSYIDDPDPLVTTAAIHYQVGTMDGDLMQDSSNPLSSIYHRLDYWFKLRAGGAYADSLPAPAFLSSRQLSNASWEFMGIDITRSVLDDTNAGGYFGQFRYDYGTGILYSLQIPLNSVGGRFYTSQHGVYTLDLDLQDWRVIGTVNSSNIYNSLPTAQTTAEGELTFSWTVKNPFEAITLVELTGYEVEITIKDDMGVVIHNDTYLLQDPPLDYYDWLFEENPAKTILKVRELPNSPNCTLTVVVRAADPMSSDPVGVGAIYPSNPKSLGGMSYAPVISATNTTRITPVLEVRGVTATTRGVLAEKLSYKTKTLAPELDAIVRILKVMSELSVEQGYPTWVEGEFPYDSLEILGHMPIYSQALDKSIQTSATINLTGAL